MKINSLHEYLIANGKNDTWAQIGKLFNVSEDAARSVYNRLKKKGLVKNINKIQNKTESQIYISDLENTIVSLIEDLNKGTAEKTVNTSIEIQTLEDLIKICNIDTKIWNIDKYIQNYYSGKFQVKAFLSKKSIEQLKLDSFKEFLENYKSPHIPLGITNKYSLELNPVMVEISLADAHIDKWGIEGDSIIDHCKKYFEILQSLVLRAHSAHNIEEIVFVIGNDYFNTDNWHSATTLHMNPQEINARWDSAYEMGFETLVESINFLRNYSNRVKVIVVEGNHAKTKEFYLGHALEVFFKKDKNIIFDRTSKPRKLHVYYNTAIMYHHGNCKIDQLPLIMASEFPTEWGNTRFHRVHTGDKHFYMEKEISGVRIKQFPSISQTDTWHNENNYILNGRVGLLNVYDREKGRIVEYEEVI